MSDYYHYIDFKAIEFADLAYELGDYKCASRFYTRALNRLQRYQGDRELPSMMYSNLLEKVQHINKLDGVQVFKPEAWALSKSSFLKGTQCLKYLYLDKYKKDERTPISVSKKALFNKGRNFESNVKSAQFPGGLDVKLEIGDFKYFNTYTKYILEKENIITLYEATIIEKEVLVMCDVLTKNAEGYIDIYEIKLNKELNQTIMEDLTIQYFVCKERFGDKLKSFNIILRKDDSDDDWSITNLINELEEALEITQQKFEIFKATLKGKEPNIKMGKHCNDPYECEFIDYCKSKPDKRSIFSFIFKN